MEEEVLEQFNWYLSSPTIHDFVTIYQEYLLDMNGLCFWVSQYLSELALQSTLYLKYPPSQIAASVVVLSRYCVYKKNSFPTEIETLSGYSFSELGESIISLSSTYTIQNNRDLKIISKRYEKHLRQRVGDLTIYEIKNSSDLNKMK